MDSYSWTWSVDQIAPGTVIKKVLNLIKQAGSLLLSVTLLSGFFFVASIKSAHAYVDLASAGLMFQMAIASAFGVLFGLKIYWRSLVGRFSRIIASIKGTKTTLD